MNILPDRRLVVVGKTRIYIFYIDLYKILVLRAQKELELHLWGGFQMILNFYVKYFLRVFVVAEHPFVVAEQSSGFSTNFKILRKIIKIIKDLRPPQMGVRPP